VRITNPRTPATLAAGLLAASLALAAPAAAQSSTERPDRVLQSAHGMLGKGLYDLAAEEYRRFFDLAGADISDDDRTTAAYGLAVSLHRLADREGALSALENARPSPSHPFAAEIALLKGACRYEMGQHDAAADALDAFLARHADHPSAPQAALMLVESLGALGETQSQAAAAQTALDRWPDAPGAPRVRLLSGVALTQLGQTDDAIAAYEQLVDTDADEAPAAALRLARLIEDSNGARAERLYEQAAAGRDDAAAAHAALALARRQREAGDAPAAIDALTAWLDRRPDSALAPSAKLELGRALLDAGRPRDALAPLAAAAETLDGPDATYWRGKALFAAGDTDAAIAAFDAAASDHPGDDLAPYALYDLGVSLRSAGETELASEVFERLRRAHPRHTLSPHAQYAQAAIALDDAEFAESRRLASSLLGAHAGHELAPDAALLLADAQYFDTRYDDAVRTLRALRESSPSFEAPYTAYRLGMALQRAGEPEDAAKALAAAAEHAEGDERLRSASLALAEIAYAGEDWDGVIENAERYLGYGRDQSGAGDAVLKIGLAQAELGRHREAIERFDELLRDEDTPHAAHAMYGKASSLRALGDDAAAEGLFRDLLARDDSERFESHAKRAIGAIALADGRSAEARRWFGEASGGDGSDPSDLVNLAQAALAGGDPEGALDALDDPSLRVASDEVRTRGRVVEALARARTDDHRGAIRLIESLQSSGDLDRETSEQLAYERAISLRAIGRDDDASDALRELAGSEDLGDRATLELAALAIEAGELDRAARAIDELLSRRNELPPSVAELAVYRRAVVAHRGGDAASAARLLNGFRRTFPESDAALSADLIAGRSLVELGRHGEAIDPLQRVVDAAPADEQLAPALLLLAESLAESQRFEDSLRVAREHLERYSGSDLWFRARFSEAWAMENLGRFDEAIASYRLVADEHEGDTAARAQFQIGECLFAKGEHEDAVAELLKTDILHASPEWSAAALYEAGRCFEALGKTGEARSQYHDTIERFPDSAWAPPAQERLRSLARAATPGRGGR